MLLGGKFRPTLRLPDPREPTVCRLNADETGAGLSRSTNPLPSSISSALSLLVEAEALPFTSEVDPCQLLEGITGLSFPGVRLVARISKSLSLLGLSNLIFSVSSFSSCSSASKV
jgi:hypothetical protein